MDPGSRTGAATRLTTRNRFTDGTAKDEAAKSIRKYSYSPRSSGIRQDWYTSVGWALPGIRVHLYKVGVMAGIGSESRGCGSSLKRTGCAVAIAACNTGCGMCCRGGVDGEDACRCVASGWRKATREEDLFVRGFK